MVNFGRHIDWIGEAPRRVSVRVVPRLVSWAPTCSHHRGRGKDTRQSLVGRSLEELDLVLASSY